MKCDMRFITCLVLLWTPVQAGQWTMFGGNPQRDGWARDETMLTRDNVKSMKLVWKIHVDSQLREMNSLTAPIVAENVLTAQGHKDIVVVAGASDTLDAIDIDTGKVLWQAILGGMPMASTITYAVNGKQYVAILVGAIQAAPWRGTQPAQAGMEENAMLYVFAL